jgi:hypothetical protein
MVFYLMSQTKRNGNEAIMDYFKRAAGNQPDADNFEQSFGIPLKDFSGKVNDWIDKTIVKLGSDEIESQGNFEQYVGIDEGFSRSQIFFQDNFGEFVRAKQRITIAPEKHTYIALLTKELRLARPKAEQIAKTNTWWASGNKVVMNLDGLPDCQTQIYQTALMMSMQFQNQQDAGHLLNGMVWFRNGMAHVFAASITRQAEVVAPDYYREQWKKSVGNIATTLTLTDLRTEDGWNQAVVRYGDSAVNSYAALAVLYLTDRNGLASFKAWLSKSKENKDSEAVFVKSFGKGVVEFSTDFKIYIMNDQK